MSEGEVNNPECPEDLKEKCDHLEHQVGALKDVSSLQRDLLRLREKEANDLQLKIKALEEALEREQRLKNIIEQRAESAETQTDQFREQLEITLASLNRAKTQFEDKISELSEGLDETKRTLRERNQELTRSEAKNLKNTERILELENLMGETQNVLREVDKKYKAACGRNEELTEQITLLNKLFQETEGGVEANKGGSCDPLQASDTKLSDKLAEIIRESRESSVSDAPQISDDSGRSSSIDLNSLINESDDTEEKVIPDEESCYRSVDTGKGPKLVLSVSLTFLKLKDLILEKKFLQRQLDTMKSVNKKLTNKISKQEHRLFLVSVELNKTWGLVSKLKSQHKRLHSNEAILKYELHEKRKLLEKLKKDLFQSREKWQKVRQKNSKSQIEWEQLRKEFSNRKHLNSEDRSEVESEVEDPLKKENRESESYEDEGLTGDGDHCEEPEDDEVLVANMSTPEGQLEELVSDLVEEIEASVADEEEALGDEEEDEEEENSNGGTAAIQPGEERLLSRAERLSILEEQCHLLHSQLLTSTARSVALASRLSHLHDHYGSSSEGESSEQTPSMDTTSSSVYYEVNQESPTIQSSVDTAYESGEGRESRIPNVILAMQQNSLEQEDSFRDFDVEPLPNFGEESAQTDSNISDQNDSLVISNNIDGTDSSDSSDDREQLDARVLHSGTSNSYDQAERPESSTEDISSIGNVSTVENTSRRSRKNSGVSSNSMDTSTSSAQRNESASSNKSPDPEDIQNSKKVSPDDPNYFGRMIIQQLPKRLEILKQENISLISEASETKMKCKDTERKLKQELRKQKHIATELKSELERKDSLEYQLREQIETKDATLNRFKNVAESQKEEVSVLLKEREQMVEIVRSFLPKADTSAPSCSRSVKSSRAEHKCCKQCNRSFGFWRWRHLCHICSHYFCSHCAPKQSSSSKKSLEALRKCRLCHDKLNEIKTKISL